MSEAASVTVVMVWRDAAELARAQADPEVAGADHVVTERWAGNEPVARARWRAFARAPGGWLVSLGERYAPARGWLGEVREAITASANTFDVIAGAVSVSAGETWLARAQYWWEYAQVAPGRLQRAAPAEIAGGHAIYRKAALAEGDFAGAWSELDYHAAMARRRLRFGFEPRMVVSYRPIDRYLTQRFEWSREEGARRTIGFGAGKRIASAAARVVLPPVLLVRAMARTGVAGTAMLPAWSAFAVAQAAGEIAGRAGR